MSEVKDMTFEEAMKELESVTAQLENGSLPLAQSLELYERGVTLLVHCKKTLDSAQLRLQELTEKTKEDLHDDTVADTEV